MATVRIGNEDTPKFMTIRETARTGILAECTLRRLVREGKIPHIMIGNKAMIDYNKLVKILNEYEDGMVL